ncbi:MAG: crotonase/enoyl-CoA hydratase family protein [Pseudomonadota bacterium]|jgi:enoyl-CoA hydratase|nr:crotonase/enoyl-CoA hydratase family protein [Pseudomonadota bacterium]MEE3172861.1 crotonase/enoyl-CoA hydratase family protein [Pseudomonadota bacterium]|tara:strand:- start:5016 stop:5885 length:870 start_codon:yes stop_codon:yes gene_type:complete
MNYSCFDVSIANDVAHIVLNRPDKRNSMIHEFWDELPTIVQSIDQNSTARVIVLSSTGPHFTSGLDTSIFGSSVESSDNPENVEKSKRQRSAKLYDTIKHMQKSFTCLEQCRIPVIAAIQGGAIGGGVDLVTACDLRYMTEDGFLSIYEINIGMTADVGTFPRITHLLPEGIVKELAYTGRRISAQEAKQHGLVNEIYTDHEAMLEATMGIALQIATKAPLAVYGSKKIINYSRDHSTADSLDYISLWNASMLQPDEISEAFAAAQEEREGDFVDLPAARRKMGTGINE